MNYGLRHGTHQVLTSASTTSASSAFANGAEYIRVGRTIACHIDIGVSPTATTSTQLLPANEIETIKISAGEKIAVLRIGSSDGKLHVTELTE